jgi:hypothetical protein
VPAKDPIGLGVKLPFANAEEFLERYGNNVTQGGIYLRTRVLHPPGTALTLSIRLLDGKQVIGAKAEVAFVTGNKIQRLPESMGNHQDIGKQNRRIESEPADRLQRYLSSEFRRETQFEKTAGLFPQRAILRKIASSLTHHPDWRRISFRPVEDVKQRFYHQGSRFDGVFPIS